MSKNLVVFDNISKSYDGESLVVAGLNLDVSKGEFLTMLGPSGSGKTTVLMMLAGFEAATSGRIFIDGVDSTKIPSHKRNLGFVFQNYALFPHMTVSENLAFPLKVRKIARAEIEDRVSKTLSMIRLDSFGDRLPAQLSGGQQQRVALARALVFEPNLVLMDEPLGALDKNLREEMQYEIKHIHENLGVTMVYVTHDQTEALVMSDRIAIFYDGLIQQVASPSAVYDEPLTTFVASFIGENNIFCGKVKSMDKDSCMVETDSGEEIIARHTASVSTGAKTTVSLRPELVCLVGDNERDKFSNVKSAMVEEIIFLGDHIRLRLDVLGNDSFILKIQHGSQDKLPSEGDVINVGWSYEDSWALDG